MIDHAGRARIEALEAEVTRLREEARTMHRGYVDLHAMLPGSKDVWTKVGDLLAKAAELRAENETLRGLLREVRATVRLYRGDEVADRIDAALAGKEQG